MNATHSTTVELKAEALRAALPDGPGVYLFKAPRGHVIYVGKAKSLKKRVLSYLRTSDATVSKSAWILKKAAGLEFIRTTTEQEAFLLERQLIKQHMPRYNVLLRDDKQYLNLRLDPGEHYPRLALVRRPRKDGAWYFGPFASAQDVRSTLRVIDRAFQLRKCKGKEPPIRSRPCLNFQLQRCLAPCCRPVPLSAYQAKVQQVKLFLEGRGRELLAQLTQEMDAAAAQLNYERAAVLRDQIRAVAHTLEGQAVVSHRLAEADVIALARREDAFQLALLGVRNGVVVGSRAFGLKAAGSTPGEVLEAFLKQYYPAAPAIPRLILVSHAMDDREGIAAWLASLAGFRVHIRCPLRGVGRRIVEMAAVNAESQLARTPRQAASDIIDRLQQVLGLARPPHTMEALDISNLYGDQAVGTVVAFAEGAPRRAGYRNFRIRETTAIDDYAMMAEMVRRRAARGRLPDLFVVDGGKGHLAAVLRALTEVPDAEAVEVLALAKPDPQKGEHVEKIYLPGRKNPVILAADDPGLLLLMRLRDEVHRRAITYHRQLRGRRLSSSELDRIPGIGPKRKAALLKHLGHVQAVAAADIEALAAVPGMNRALALRLHDHFAQARGLTPPPVPDGHPREDA